jgi:hypothetical protein
MEAEIDLASEVGVAVSFSTESCCRGKTCNKRRGKWRVGPQKEKVQAIPTTNWLVSHTGYFAGMGKQLHVKHAGATFAETTLLLKDLSSLKLT